VSEHDVESDAPNVDAGGKAHTKTTEPHPAGDGARTDRDVGGPVAEEGAEEATGGVKGASSPNELEPHE
jgi:hypothetical protein